MGGEGKSGGMVKWKRKKVQLTIKRKQKVKKKREEVKVGLILRKKNGDRSEEAGEGKQK